MRSTEKVKPHLRKVQTAGKKAIPFLVPLVVGAVAGSAAGALADKAFGKHKIIALIVVSGAAVVAESAARRIFEKRSFRRPLRNVPLLSS